MFETAVRARRRRRTERKKLMAHGYESGRLDLPFVGICTFGKYPLAH